MSDANADVEGTRLLRGRDYRYYDENFNELKITRQSTPPGNYISMTITRNYL